MFRRFSPCGDTADPVTSMRRGGFFALPFRQIALAITALVATSGLWAHPVAAQVADPSFWVTDGIVNAVSLDGGTLYIGGLFQRVGPYTGALLPFDAGTGALQASWPRIDGAVTAIAPDGAGGFYISGVFTRVGGLTRNRFARIRADRSVDPWFAGLTANGAASSIVVSGSTVYVGGQFTTVGGQPRVNLAALDATTGAPTSWNPGANGIVKALAISGGVVFASGFFTTAGGQPRSALAAIDAGTGLATAWDAGADTPPGSFIEAMCIDGGNLYVCGDFTTIGGQARATLAALDVTTAAATSWDPNPMNGPVTAMRISGSTMYVGGKFNTIGGQVRYNLAALDLATGLATAWDPNSLAEVSPFNSSEQPNGITVSGSTVYVAGSFTASSPGQRTLLAAIDATTGALTSWNPVTVPITTSISGAAMYGVEVSGGSVLTISNVASIGGAERSNLAALDATTGIPTSWNPGADNRVRALTPSGGLVYVGGDFVTIGGQTRSLLAAVDAVTGVPTSWDPYIQGSFVDCITLGSGVAYVGGFFTLVGLGLTPRNNAAAIDLATGAATAWDPNTSSTVVSIALGPTSAFLGGVFTTVGGLGRTRLAEVDLALGTPTGWIANANLNVRPVVLDGSTLYVGGDFTIIGGVARNRLAALDAITGVVLPWNPNASSGVNALLLGSGVLYAGGGFNTVSGLTRRGVAEIDLSTGTPTAWNPNVAGNVTSLAAGTSGFYTGGQYSFTPPAGRNQLNLTRILPADVSPPATTLLSPNGGQTLVIGSTATLNWSASDPLTVPRVDLFLSRSGPGGPWETLATGLRNTGSYPWLVTGPIALSTVYVRVDAYDDPGNLGSDASDAGNSIDEGSTPTLVDLFRAEETADGVRLEWRITDPFLAANAAPERGVTAVGEWVRLGGPIDEQAGVRTLVDREPIAGTDRWYRLAGALRGGQPFASAAIELVSGGPVTSFAISPLAPNPTGGQALLTISVPTRANVRISLVDIQGREVSVLADGVREPGRHAMRLDARDMPPGLYFLRMQGRGVDVRRRVVLVR